jgi:Flp pilus assembly protein TadD
MCIVMTNTAASQKDIQTYLAVFGIEDRPSQEAVEARYRELSEYFATTSFPPNLNHWAKQQTALVDEAYAVLLGRSAVEPSIDETVSGEMERARPSAEKGVRSTSDAAKQARTVRLRPLLAAGVMLVAIAGAVVLARVGVPGKSAAAPAVAQEASDIVPVDAKRSAELMTALQQNPQNKDALFELGEMNFLATQWQPAIDWFTKLLALDPSNTHARTDVGTAQFNLGRMDEAATSWLAGLEIAPNDVQLNFNMGFLYANAEPQDLAAARKAWQKVIDVDPNSSLAKTAQSHMSSLVAVSAGSGK